MKRKVLDPILHLRKALLASKLEIHTSLYSTIRAILFYLKARPQFLILKTGVRKEQTCVYSEIETYQMLATSQAIDITYPGPGMRPPLLRDLWMIPQVQQSEGQ